MEKTKNDFTKGSMARNIMNMALPMTMAQLINVLYNVVDRIYIGRIPVTGTMALTGLGLTFPILMAISAFANLFGMGGAPLCSIARGKGDTKGAGEIMCCSYTLLLISGLGLTIVCFLLVKPILFLFGASEVTYPYARDYLQIYLCGTIFVLLSLGMNNFINAQGFGRMGMLTVLCGAITNIVLDPLFIFVLHMGVKGAALATVISQGISAAWVLHFLSGPKALLRLKPTKLFLRWDLTGRITAMGVSGFTFAVTNSAVQVVCNTQLQLYGGDLYVGVMTILNSVRDILTMPANGITNGAQPVLGYNYGARAYRRVKEGVKFMTVTCLLYTLFAWMMILLFPTFFIRLFNGDGTLITAGIPAMHIYFFGFIMMTLQFAGQSTFVALGKAKHATFFSIFRKIIIVVPLTLLLPRIGFGVNGVFLAEPISNLVGGAACFLTMLYTVWPTLREENAI